MSVAKPSGIMTNQLSAWPWLMGLGTATPPLRVSQSEIADRLGDVWKLSGARLDRWRRIVAGTGIDTRHAVMPIEQVPALSTRARMEAYERAAPDLARAAAGQALRAAAVEPAKITDLVVVSCTGFSAPGVDVSLVEGLGLAPTVRRTVVGFMGCFGAIIGLRAATAVCRAEPGAVALVLCVELCSLHLRADRSLQNQVASALFSDGAAAAVVAGPAGPFAPGPWGGGAAPLGRVTLGHSRLLPQGRDWMTWRITDAGFAMTLAPEVPSALGRAICGIVEEAAPTPPESFAIHPGGPAIIDAVDEGLRLGGSRGVESARDVLRRFGNMSSATVLFVLQETLRRGHAPPTLMLAFGPGLSVESLLVLSAE